MNRTYTELCTLPTFKERYLYLKLKGLVGEETFGFERYLNQRFYKTPEWKQVRDYVITRDMGCDLGVKDRLITGRILVHHLNPITLDDLIHHENWVIDPEYLISVSEKTHNAIHYGNESLLMDDEIVERSPFDTSPWR